MKRTLFFIFFTALNGLLFAQTATIVADISPTDDSYPSQFHYVNGMILFMANGPSGAELYTTDGTSGGTVLVKDVNQTGNAFSYNPWAILNDKAYFVLNDGVHGRELWVSDGTSGGTVLVKDVNPTAGIDQDLNDFIITYNNKIYFAANDGTHGVELWVSDGTQGGTSMVKDINTSGDGVD